MLQRLGDHISACLQRADQCKEAAALETDERVKTQLLEMERAVAARRQKLRVHRESRALSARSAEECVAAGRRKSVARSCPSHYAAHNSSAREMEQYRG